jgi:hypothetical protein
MIRRIFGAIARRWKTEESLLSPAHEDRTSMAEFVRILREAEGSELSLLSPQEAVYQSWSQSLPNDHMTSRKI